MSGEDWAEVGAALLGGLIHVPVASVRLGRYQGRRGVLSRSVVPTGWALVHGNELLSRGHDGYVGGMPTENPGYTVEAVRARLRYVPPPADEGGWLCPAEMDAFDVWAGYLVFDAWVAGCDRHDENWGVIADGVRQHLAPSFDHGNALGFQVRPSDHRVLADDPQALRRWASRGRCRYFAGRPRLTDLAASALALATPSARTFWLDQLAGISPARIESVLVRAPVALLSESSRRFCERLLLTNRRRLLDGD